MYPIDWGSPGRVTRTRAMLSGGSRLRSRVLAIALTATAGLLGASPSQALSVVPTDGRAWELVTFSEPTSASLLSINPMGSSADELAYRTLGPPPGSSSGAFLGSGEALRGATGWSNHPVGLPFSSQAVGLFELLAPVATISYSEDLQTKLWLTTVPVTSGAPPEGQQGLYRQVDEGPPQFIAHVGEGFTFEYASFADLSRDGSKVIFTTAEHLLPGDAGRTQGESVYLWDSTGLHLVDTDTGGALLSACGSKVSQANGMSASANRIFFTTPAVEGCGEAKEVYLRSLAAGTTTEISASQCTRVDCNAPQDVSFVGATPDGSSAFLVTAQQLTDDDHDTSSDLYRYDVGSGDLQLLSGGSAEAEGNVNQADVYPSNDGSHVYFRATGVMVPGELTTGEKLFLADGSGIHLVAAAEFPTEPQIQSSDSGESALFVTSSKVAEEDTDAQQDVYLYDAASEAVTRVSAGASGGNGPFDANIESPYALPELEPGDKHPFYAIDASGDRVFFTTQEPLLPEDVNSKLDVYEWTEGKLGLVTPGTEEVDSKFGGASRDGRSVLFGTSSTLAPADQDGGDVDFYSAQLGGGFPQLQPASPCAGAPCSHPARPRLSARAPASLKLPPAKRLKRIRLLGVRSPGGGSAVRRRTSILVAVPIPGLISASVWVRHEGKRVVLASGRKGAVKPGKLGVDLHLTAAGRGAAGTGISKGRLSVKEDGARGASSTVRIDMGGGA